MELARREAALTENQIAIHQKHAMAQYDRAKEQHTQGNITDIQLQEMKLNTDRAELEAEKQRLQSQMRLGELEAHPHQQKLRMSHLKEVKEKDL
jgi:hypothetical protein